MFIKTWFLLHGNIKDKNDIICPFPFKPVIWWSLFNEILRVSKFGAYPDRGHSELCIKVFVGKFKYAGMLSFTIVHMHQQQCLV